MKDKFLKKLQKAEKSRQEEELELIASENYVSKAVLKAQISSFANKYSEWYPSNRYYWGQKYVDMLERLTQYRALKIFWLIENIYFKNDIEKDSQILEKKLGECDWFANVQPLSWSPANLAVFLWTLDVWDKVLAMDLSAWGHLTHWHKLSSSWILYNFLSYWVDEKTHLIDYEDIEKKALSEKPKMIIAGFSNYPRNIEWKKFSQIADKVEKKHWYRPILFADIAHISGLIAWKQLQWPFEYFDIVSTTTHKTLRWPRWAMIIWKKQYEKQINRGVFPAVQWGPHMHQIAAKCQAFFEADSEKFVHYAEKIIQNSKFLAQKLLENGWNLVSGWTDNHLICFDVTTNSWKTTKLSWKKAEKMLEDIWISVNKNMIPFDKKWALDPSWIRIWTPAVTTRGLWEKDMENLADIITDCLLEKKPSEELKKQVLEMCKKYPLKY